VLASYGIESTFKLWSIAATDASEKTAKNRMELEADRISKLKLKINTLLEKNLAEACPLF